MKLLAYNKKSYSSEFMLKCEICYDWCRRIETTKQWWDIARNDWESLNGKDLPYYIAILTVLRETTIEIFDNKKPTSKNHSMMEKDLRGYSLTINKNCKFIPLTETQKNKWTGFYQTIRIFRNSAAHVTYIQSMNPYWHNEIMNPEDRSQDYYRYAPSPHIDIDDSQLKKVHEFVKESILVDVRRPASNTPSHRIHYELYHVERGPFIDLLHSKMIELLKEVKSY